MTRAELIKEIEGMKSTLLLMESRIEELEARSTTPAPPYQGGELSEATDDDLIYILRTKGFDEYRQALKVRNKIRAKRDNAFLGNRKGLPLQRGGEKRRAA